VITDCCEEVYKNVTKWINENPNSECFCSPIYDFFSVHSWIPVTITIGAAIIFLALIYDWTRQVEP